MLNAMSFVDARWWVTYASMVHARTWNFWPMKELHSIRVISDSYC